MKKSLLLWLCLGCSAAVSTSRAIDLKQSKITQVVNDVEIISAADQNTKTAAVNDIFSMPDILRTGKSSRAELVAKDETITRVGANTIFSFDPASRTIDLKQGSLLFHSPHGKGGGTIRTGSATASVLGTTLIVTTTKDGGMKVLDLEGTVEVNHQNKKKQKLQSGQMTFILPGGSQLAPVIVFRLDELVRNSQLVHGFGQQLSSMPLIQDQINNQNKLIKSGKAQDTGLLVGDSATANQVEVIDPNSIHTGAHNSINASAALHSDATISSSSLTDPNIPTPPNRIFLNRSFSLAGNPFYAGQTFRGFAARNITFTSANPLAIDMTAYASKPAFAFVAAEALNLNTSVSFDGLSSQSVLSLVGGQQMNFAQGIELTANVADFQISTAGPLTMDDVTIVNNTGKLTLTSGSEINLYNIHFYPAGTTTYSAPNAVNLTWGGDAVIGKLGAADDNVILTDPTTGHVTLTSQTGSLNVDSTDIQTHYLTLNSGDSILLDATGRYLKTVGPGATANFTAPNLITVQNADFSAFALVNMVANTIVVKGTTFNPDGTYNFGTGTGQASINGPVINGRLNLINDRIGGTAITDVSQINFTTGPGTGPGIFSYKK
jgi:hypothetical protein